MFEFDFLDTWYILYNNIVLFMLQIPWKVMIDDNLWARKECWVCDFVKQLTSAVTCDTEIRNCPENTKTINKVMPSTVPLESLLYVSSLLAVRLYQNNPDNKHKL